MIILGFILFLILFGIFINYTINPKKFKENFLTLSSYTIEAPTDDNSWDDNQVNIDLDDENCEKRVWDATSEKGWKCAAPLPKDPLVYSYNSNVKYHDTIDDIKSQNPDLNIDFKTIKFKDSEGNEFTKVTTSQQNNAKYSGDGRYKYGYSNYVPKYHESVLLSELKDIAQKDLEEGKEKLNQEYDETYNVFSYDTIDKYNKSRYKFNNQFKSILIPENNKEYMMKKGVKNSVRREKLIW